MVPDKSNMDKVAIVRVSISFLTPLLNKEAL
jgi:hypothetical protein